MAFGIHHTSWLISILRALHHFFETSARFSFKLARSLAKPKLQEQDLRLCRFSKYAWNKLDIFRLNYCNNCTKYANRNAVLVQPPVSLQYITTKNQKIVGVLQIEPSSFNVRLLIKLQLLQLRMQKLFDYAWTVDCLAVSSCRRTVCRRNWKLK